MNDSEIATGFADLGLRPELLSALAGLGYEEPTPIQRETIPHLLEGRDLLGQAATGTGKTAAFALPILQRIPDGRGKAEPVALVLVPTRELAVQVSEALYKYGRDLGAKVVPIYGGQPIFRQLQALSAGVHVVVATPGRALDHISRNSLPLDSVQMVVLDEADEMLDMGFAEDIETILQSVPKQRQTILFSATLPPRINGIAKRHLIDPVKIQIGLGDSKPGKSLIRQTVYIVQRAHKAAALGRILDVEAPTAAIVFCRTRTEVDTLTETLNGRGYRAEALHGGLSQESRDRVMSRLRAGTTELLVATDVAARGLDIDQLTHVVNFDVPAAPESYVHRIGRVGRAGREGVAITLAEPREQRLLMNIERLTKQKIAVEKVPTVADLRAVQIEQTLDLLREALKLHDLDKFETVVDVLTQDFDIREIALAAVKLTHEASGATVDDKEIPDASQRLERKDRPGADKGGKFDKRRPDSGAPTGGGGYAKSGRSGSVRPQHDSGETARLYVSLGRKEGIRPGDLVGAIANETNLSGREIGPIKLAEHFSIVGVPEWAADDVIEALKRTTLKNQKATVRRYTD
ncbi:MAG: DEAD/DEAH box helicase [Ilumatobacteraceae bacterium]